MMAKEKILTKDFLNSVPKQPGVYLMKDESGTILYVGKAKDLRKRLSSYSRLQGSDYSKTGVMLGKVCSIETILTTTEKEAFILEASFIKKEKPKYNIILRDDKNYPLIKITVQEKWPRLLMTRRRGKDGAKYYGPYSSSSSMWRTIRYLSKLFPLRKCKGEKVKQRERPCLNYQMNRCLAPCFNKVSHEEYMLVVQDIKYILEGKNRELIQKLKKEMEAASQKLEFERAAQIRDKINALERTVEKQIVVSEPNVERDIYGYWQEKDSVAVSVLHVRHGIINGYQHYYFNDPVGSDKEIMAEFLERFYSADRDVPREIVLSFQPLNHKFLTDWLTTQKGVSVTLRVPGRGDGLKLLAMAEKNAKQVFKDKAAKAESWDSLAASIVAKLKLRAKPDRIICLDISNTGGKQSVGAVVSSFNGEKESLFYRHYKIQSVEGPDDYASMREVLLRHLQRAVEGQFLPDLVIVDGGRGQLGKAVTVLAELGLEDRIELVGIAKERDAEGEKLYRPGRKNHISLESHSRVLLYIMGMRDEAHRYGITFHRKWRQREAMASPLDTIPGVGPARKKVLLSQLGSLAKIREATIFQLNQVDGINASLAVRIYETLKKERVGE